MDKWIVKLEKSVWWWRTRTGGWGILILWLPVLFVSNIFASCSIARNYSRPECFFTSGTYAIWNKNIDSALTFLFVASILILVLSFWTKNLSRRTVLLSYGAHAFLSVVFFYTGIMLKAYFFPDENPDYTAVKFERTLDIFLYTTLGVLTFFSAFRLFRHSKEESPFWKKVFHILFFIIYAVFTGGIFCLGIKLDSLYRSSDTFGLPARISLSGATHDLVILFCFITVTTLTSAFFIRRNSILHTRFRFYAYSIPFALNAFAGMIVLSSVLSALLTYILAQGFSPKRLGVLAVLGVMTGIWIACGRMLLQKKDIFKRLKVSSVWQIFMWIIFVPGITFITDLCFIQPLAQILNPDTYNTLGKFFVQPKYHGGLFSPWSSDLILYGSTLLLLVCGFFLMLIRQSSDLSKRRNYLIFSISFRFVILNLFAWILFGSLEIAYKVYHRGGEPGDGLSAGLILLDLLFLIFLNQYCLNRKQSTEHRVKK